MSVMSTQCFVLIYRKKERESNFFYIFSDTLTWLTTGLIYQGFVRNDGIICVLLAGFTT